MKISTKKQRILDHLDEIEKLIVFFAYGNNPFEKEMEELREMIEELCLDQKEHDIRLAKKLKVKLEKKLKNE